MRAKIATAAALVVAVSAVVISTALPTPHRPWRLAWDYPADTNVVFNVYRSNNFWATNIWPTMADDEVTILGWNTNMFWKWTALVYAGTTNAHEWQFEATNAYAEFGFFTVQSSNKVNHLVSKL